jgi:hypothetical protein
MGWLIPSELLPPEEMIPKNPPKGGFGGMKITKADKKHIPMGRKILNTIYGPGAEKMSKSEMFMTGLLALGQGFRAYSRSGQGLEPGPSALEAVRGMTRAYSEEEPMRQFREYARSRIGDPATSDWEKGQLVSRLAGVPGIPRDPLDVALAGEQRAERRYQQRRAEEPPDERWAPAGKGRQKRQRWNRAKKRWEDELEDGKPVTQRRYKEASQQRFSITMEAEKNTVRELRNEYLAMDSEQRRMWDGPPGLKGARYQRMNQFFPGETTEEHEAWIRNRDAEPEDLPAPSGLPEEGEGGDWSLFKPSTWFGGGEQEAPKVATPDTVEFETRAFMQAHGGKPPTDEELQQWMNEQGY